jgi:hypothetical protein
MTTSERMKMSWANRKAKKQTGMTVDQFMEAPCCLCGCGEELPKATAPERQRLYRPGHDARVKGQALRIVRGQDDATPLHPAAKAMKAYVGFLASRPELKPAFD